MGETLQPVIPGFNRSLRIESRADRLTGDPGAVQLREVLERSDIVSWMTSRLNDPRSKVDVTNDLASLIRTSVLLAAQGWRDQDGAVELSEEGQPRRIRLAHIPNGSSKTLHGFIGKVVTAAARVITDGWLGYENPPSNPHEVRVVQRQKAHEVLKWGPNI